MQGLVALAVLVLLLAVVWVVTQPLRGPRPDAERDEQDDRRAALETARDAKYREIRDAELDHATGKLDDADWRAVDRQLRAEAVDLLRELDALGERPVDPPARRR